MADTNTGSNIEKNLNELKSYLSSNVEFWQPTILYNEELKLDKRGKDIRHITFPFTPPNIFKSETDAQIFAGIYIKSLIYEGNLPPEAISADGKNNEDIVKIFINKVILTAIEKDEG